MKCAKLKDFAISVIEEGVGTRKGALENPDEPLLKLPAGDSGLPLSKPSPGNGTFNEKKDL